MGTNELLLLTAWIITATGLNVIFGNNPIATTSILLVSAAIVLYSVHKTDQKLHKLRMLMLNNGLDPDIKCDRVYLFTNKAQLYNAINDCVINFPGSSLTIEYKDFNTGWLYIDSLGSTKRKA